MSFRNAVQQQAAVAAAQMENAKKQTVEAVYADHQDFVRCEANARAILAAIARWTGGSADVLPSKAVFDEALLENPEEINNFARQAIPVIHQQLVSEILTLLRAHSRRDEFMLKSEEARMKSWSVDALRIRLSELKTKIRMTAEPVSALKEMVAASRPNTDFPALPRQVWSSEQGKHVTVDSTYLKALDPFALRKFCRLYSTEAVNQRLAGN